MYRGIKYNKNAADRSGRVNMLIRSAGLSCILVDITTFQPYLTKTYATKIIIRLTAIFNTVCTFFGRASVIAVTVAWELFCVQIAAPSRLDQINA